MKYFILLTIFIFMLLGEVGNCGKVAKTEYVKKQNNIEVVATVTAFTPSADETDADPWVTAHGVKTQPWVTVATRMLPFGTRIRIPNLFGDRVFVVHDKTAEKYRHRVDVCVHSKDVAYKIGKSKQIIEILM